MHAQYYNLCDACNLPIAIGQWISRDPVRQKFIHTQCLLTHQYQPSMYPQPSDPQHHHQLPTGSSPRDPSIPTISPPYSHFNFLPKNQQYHSSPTSPSSPNYIHYSSAVPIPPSSNPDTPSDHHKSTPPPPQTSRQGTYPHPRAAAPRKRSKRLSPSALGPRPTLHRYQDRKASNAYVKEEDRWINFFSSRGLTIPGVHVPFTHEAVDKYLFSAQGQRRNCDNY